MLYDVTGYKNTGFNLIDRPANPSVLFLAEKVSFKNCYYRQNEPISMVKVEAEYAEVKDIDYIRVGDAYYNVINLTMLTDHTAQFTLALDGLCTVGGVEGLTVIDGWVERSHASNDEMFSNILPEGFTPSMELKVDAPRLLKEGSTEIDGKYYNLQGQATHKEYVSSTVELLSLTREAESYIDSTRDLGVTVPSIPSVGNDKGAIYRIYYNQTVNQYRLPEVKVYTLSDVSEETKETILKNIQIAQSLGIQTCLRNSYMIPNVYIQVHGIDEDEPGRIRFMAGIEKTVTGGLPFKYSNYTAKNNKAYCLFNTYAIMNPSSGNKLDYEAKTIYENGTTEPQFRLYSDLSPEGAPYVSPKVFEGSTPVIFQNACRGDGWLSTPLGVEGQSGSLISQMQASRNMLNNEKQFEDMVNKSNRDIATGFLKGAANVLTGTHSTPLTDTITEGPGITPGISMMSAGSPSGLISGAVGFGIEALQRSQGVSDIDFARRALERQQNDAYVGAKLGAISAPTILFNSDPHIQGYVGNTFYISRTRLSDNDLRRFDEYLTQFGYSQDKKLEKTDFTNRRYFNYIKTRGANVKTARGMRLNNLVDEELNGGVRLWHVLPNSSAMTDNPIRS